MKVVNQGEKGSTGHTIKKSAKMKRARSESSDYEQEKSRDSSSKIGSGEDPATKRCYVKVNNELRV